MPIRPEDAVADWAARAERQAAQTTELGKQLSRAQASARSYDDMAMVTVETSAASPSCT